MKDMRKGEKQFQREGENKGVRDQKAWVIKYLCLV